MLFPSVAETPKASIKDNEPPLPIILSGIVAYGFVGQPFSKQLYMNEEQKGAQNAGAPWGTVGHLGHRV